MEVEVGKIVEGKVTGITNFGAFVLLSNGKTGLVHISEVALAYVKDINEHLKAGDVVKVKVMSIDEKGKVSLSIKKAVEEEQKANARKPAQVEFARTMSNELSFEDKMKMFMQDSDEKMTDIRRNMDSKRGGGSYRRSSANM